MLSATALLFESPRTYEMMARHPEEKILGVQVTGRNADEIGRAVEILGRRSFETIDINMGCPVQKVVKGGCGSALLRDPELVYAMAKAAVNATDKPLSVKIRLGWDRSSMTCFEVADAVQSAGAAWLTVHGRFRCDDYAVPVDLDRIAEIKRRLRIPVIGNGNLFSHEDVEMMFRVTGVDGVMISRGALGNPWVFREIKTGSNRLTRDEWLETVFRHLDYQAETYGDAGHGAVCMRKHLLWYVKGWQGAKRLREQLGQNQSMSEARAALSEFAAELGRIAQDVRHEIAQESGTTRFRWDPKFEMDRQLDRGVGDDLIGASTSGQL
jgi:nifR3 family TIM-barrel protein